MKGKEEIHVERGAYRKIYTAWKQKREKDRKDRWRSHKEMEADLKKEKEGGKKDNQPERMKAQMQEVPRAG